jgi:hypothetical protein
MRFATVARKRQQKSESIGLKASEFWQDFFPFYRIPLLYFPSIIAELVGQPIGNIGYGLMDTYTRLVHPLN